MSSSALASKTWALRPGLISGHYPEKDELQDHWIERSLTHLQGILASFRIDQQRDLQQVVAKIEQQGEKLTGLDRSIPKAMVSQPMRSGFIPKWIGN